MPTPSLEYFENVLNTFQKFMCQHVSMHAYITMKIMDVDTDMPTAEFFYMNTFTLSTLQIGQTPHIDFISYSLSTATISSGHNTLICEILYVQYCKHMSKHCIHCMGITLLSF